MDRISLPNRPGLALEFDANNQAELGPCPDCGKNIAFRGRCPKCGGNSWIPAGHSGGVFERMKAQRWRQLISAEDDTGSLRAKKPPAAAEEEAVAERR